MLINIHTFSFKKMHLKQLSAKWRPFCLSLNVLTLNAENQSQAATTYQPKERDQFPRIK